MDSTLMGAKQCLFSRSFALALLTATLLGATDCGEPRDQAIGSIESAITAGRYSVKSISTISYAPNSFVIGNVYPGWTDDLTGTAVFRAGPGNPNGATYVWGYIYGNNFDYCAWIDQTNVNKTQNQPKNGCGAPQSNYDTPLFKATYTDGTINPGVSDGCDTHMHYAGNGCADHNGYGNVEPWRVPATPDNATGAVPEGRLLRWRYVTKDGKWVLIHDPTQGVNPNWYFVQRGCVSLNPWCGGEGDPCCNPNNSCDGGKTGCDNGLVCAGKTCCLAHCEGRCGGASDGCGGVCNGNCANQQVCSNQACAACGGNGQPCCDGNACGNGLACMAGVCTAPPPPCGAAGQTCCNGNCNNGLDCRQGVCCAPNCNGLCGGAGDGCGGTCNAPCPEGMDASLIADLATPSIEDATMPWDAPSIDDLASAPDARSPAVDLAAQGPHDSAADGGPTGVTVTSGCACAVGHPRNQGGGSAALMFLMLSLRLRRRA